MKRNQFQIDVGSAKLAGIHAGDGPPVVFLHAGVADRRMWHPQIDTFCHDHLVIAYDRRGFGETTAIDEPFSHVDDLDAVLDHFGLGKVTLVGCSQGGRIAIDFALQNPNRVTALALIAPAVSGASGPEEWPPQIEALGDALDAADEADDLDQINEIEAHMWLDGPLSQAGRVQGELRNLFLDMNGIALNMPELEKEIEPDSSYERVEELTMPAVVIWGALDFPHLIERCQYLVESIPGAKGHEIEKAAHMVSCEKAEEVNGLLFSAFSLTL
ncbi:MAG: alpha/beta hydrolase [Chloroflexota bacterium]